MMVTACAAGWGIMARTKAKTTTKTIEPKTSAAKSVVSLKVTLRGTKPPVWRRLLVPGALTLGELHHAIQAAMGWHDSHLHAFDIDGRQYGDRSTVDDVADERRLTLNSLMKSGIARFAYTYDFGDDWEHIVAIEKTQPALEGKSYPTCVAGARNCPPEDCGGCWGYEHLLEVLADPTHPEHAEQIEWIDEDFDPNEFSIENANVMLAVRFGRK
jgi:pRiA4b ORF-3-like protein